MAAAAASTTLTMEAILHSQLNVRKLSPSLRIFCCCRWLMLVFYRLIVPFLPPNFWFFFFFFFRLRYQCCCTPMCWHYMYWFSLYTSLSGLMENTTERKSVRAKITMEQIKTDFPCYGKRYPIKLYRMYY